MELKLAPKGHQQEFELTAVVSGKHAHSPAGTCQLFSEETQEASSRISCLLTQATPQSCQLEAGLQSLRQRESSSQFSCQCDPAHPDPTACLTGNTRDGADHILRAKCVLYHRARALPVILQILKPVNIKQPPTLWILNASNPQALGRKGKLHPLLQMVFKKANYINPVFPQIGFLIK